MAPESTIQTSRLVRNPNFWLIVAMLAVGALFHYGSHIEVIRLLTGGEAISGLTRHTMERILFLLPITYAGFVFGPLIGFCTLLVAAVLMLPRAIFVSPVPVDALIETASVLGVGGLVILGFELLEKERMRRAQAIAKLEVAQQELKSQVQIIEQDKKRLSALNAISAITSQSLELEPVLNRALEEVLETMSIEAKGGIFLVDAETEELVLSAQQGLSPDFIRQEERIAPGECLCGMVARSGELLISQDCSQDPRHSRQSKAGSHSHVIVPLKSKAHVLGVMFLYPQASYSLAAQDIELLAAIGNQIGVAVENISLYKKQQAVAEQLRVSEKNYRELFETANDAILVQAMDGKIVTVNSAATRLTGYPHQELIGMHIRDLLLPEGLEMARGVRQRLLQGEVVEPYEQQAIKKDGTIIIMKLTTSVITADGKVTGFQHIARDETEEKRMRDNLRFYIQQVTKVQEEERKRIARELHDDTIQELVALSLQLDGFSDSRGQLSEDAIKRLDKLQNQVGNIIRSVRRFSQDLRPSILDDLGLVAALESVADEIMEQHGIATEVKVIGEPRRPSPEKELLLFRIVQEGARNVWRHSQASKVSITTEFTADKIKITIQDNGRGFRLPARLGDLASAGQLGVVGMHERAQLLGGTLTVQSELHKGTTITVETPM